MGDWTDFVTVALSAIAALFAVLAFLRAGRRSTGLSRDEAADLLRTEFDRSRRSSDEQARAARQELGDNQRGFQDTTLKVFGELAQSLSTQMRAFGERLDAGMQTIDGRAAAISSKLDSDLKLMGEEAARNRDALRQAIDARLDEAAGKQTAAAKDLREEVSGSVQRLSEGLLRAAGEQRTLQTEQFEAFAHRLGQSLASIETRSTELKDALQKNLIDFGTTAGERHKALEHTLTSRLSEMLEANAKNAEALRGEMTANLQLLGTNMGTTLNQIGAQQKERLDVVSQELRTLTEKHERAQEALRQAVEVRLDALRTENSAKLDEMRRTVDEKLQSTLEQRFDEAATKQAVAAKDLREEVAGSVQRLSDALTKSAGEQRTLQTEQFEAFAGRLSQSLATIETRSKDIDDALQKSLVDFGTMAGERHQALQHTLASRLSEMLEANTKSTEILRGELTTSLQQLSATMTTALNQIGAQQKERLDIVGQELRALTEKHEKGQEALRQTVEARLDALRTENSAKLDEMRRTVDEKLQSTLEQRLGESFTRVVEQLERVHKGIGEMQTLAAGVGDLKKVLSNVSVRGALGEIQLAMLLEQFLSPEQLIKNAVVQDGSSERVEFAVKLPGRDSDREVLLPIDAKFPQEDYERLVTASHLGDAEAVAEAGRALENRVKLFAKTIREKYIHPPRTTDFAILFLPTEGLYAEVLRRPGLFEFLQREHHVSLTGPTTLTAFLNALQMGFRSVAIEKRSSEVWQVLGAVRSEFGKYNKVVDQIAKQLSTAAKSVENLGTRTRVMSRKLRDVETLPNEAAQALLGFEANGTAVADDEEEAAAAQ